MTARYLRPICRLLIAAFLLAVSVALVVGDVKADENEDDDDPSATASILGTVTDASTDRPLPRANVALIEAQTGTSTGTNGRFELGRVRAGEYTVIITHIGYASQQRMLSLDAGQRLQLDVSLEPASITVEEFTVSADQTPNRDSRSLAVTRMEIEDLTEIPSALESDVFRSLQKLPGINASSDFSSGLNVRGGSPDQTLIRLNGATLYNPTHFLGLFSSFNPDAVESIKIHKGAYPVNYGGRLGSVLEIDHYGGTSESIKPRVTAGLLASRAMLEGPLERGSWMFSFRRSTMEPVLSQLNARDIEGTPETFHFHDINGSLNTSLSRSDRLDLTLYSGADEMRFPFSSNMLFDVAYSNQAASARWTHIAGDQLLSRVTAAASRYVSDSKALLSRSPFTRRSGIYDLSLTADFEYQADPRHTVDGGVRLGYLGGSLEDIRASQTQLDRRQQTVRGDLYLQDTYRITPQWTLQGGLRGSYFTAGNYLRLAPRFSLDYSPQQNLRLQIAGGRYLQFLTLNASQFISSFDAWLPSGEGAPPSYGDQIGAGAKTTIASNLHFDVEIYYRTMKDLFELDPRRGDTSDKSYGELFQFGKGYAYGVEAMLKQSSGRFNGFAAYTYGKTRRRFDAINGGRYYAPRHDRTHDLSLVANYHLTDRWKVSSTFTYTSGQPYTQPSNHYRLVDSPHHAHFENVFITSYNNARMPSYHRLDVGLSRRGKLFDRAKYHARLQIINVYSRRNMWFYLYEFDGNQVSETAMPQIPVPLPNLSLSLEF